MATTSREWFIPYISRYHRIAAGISVLEVGCGEGGNLLPFSTLGCRTTGVDIASCRIVEARSFFAESHAEGAFIAEDIFKLNDLERLFDIIICHDVFEHISEKERFLVGLERFMKPDGVMFMAFPAWQMPFGGHQQICRSRLMSHLPFVHLLPSALYKRLLRACGEDERCVSELLSIKRTCITIERFERLLTHSSLHIVDRRLWFINPHYKAKFGLSPRQLSPLLAAVPYFRNFFCTGCFYILRRKGG